MGGESANEYVDKAIRGENVPESQRSQYNKETVYSRGSANICCLQAACDGWYWYHRDKSKARDVLKSWEGYLELNRWFTSEPWSSHRYGTWINMSYEAVAHLAKLLGNKTVEEGLNRYLRFEMLSTILTMGWTSKAGHGFSYARGGSRSWCGWDGPNGKGTGDPYDHLIEDAGIGRNVNNWFGRCAESNWELEPILDALYARGHRRWSYLSVDDKTLCLRLVKGSSALSASGVADLERLLGKIRSCNVQNHSTVHLVKTTQGTGWLAEKTHGAGSTSFMVGKVWYKGQRNSNENKQVWADKYDKHFAPVFEGNKARRSDPGGYGSAEWDGSKFVFKAWTGSGDCSNGYLPGANKHNDGRNNPRDPAGWKDGPQVVTLGGDRIWHVKITGRTGQIESIYPGGDTPPPPPPPSDKIDMLEVLAPSSVDFAKTSSVGGMFSTIRDDANRVFVVVKYSGKTWDWFYWDDQFVYHVITEDGDSGDPTAFKTHVAPGVIWCKRFATLGESHVSSPVFHQWRNCSQRPAMSLASARTTLHSRPYSAGELGMASDDIPKNTNCYRIDWRWGPNASNLETFTYAAGWGFLDWDLSGYDVKPFNKRSSKPIIQPDFPCFNVPDWVDENMRGDDPPDNGGPPVDTPPGGWNTVKTPHSAYMKMNNAEVVASYDKIKAGLSGSNHMVTRQCAVLPEDVPAVERQLKAIIDSW